MILPVPKKLFFLFLLITFFTNISSVFGVTLEDTEKFNGYLGFLVTPIKKFFNYVSSIFTEDKPPFWKYQAKNVAVFAYQALRYWMEDRFLIDENFKRTGVSLYALFGGHGGDFCAKYAVDYLMKSLKSKIINLKTENPDDNLKKYINGKSINYEQLLTDEILALEKLLLKELETQRNETIKELAKKENLDLEQYTDDNGEIDEERLFEEGKLKLQDFVNELNGSGHDSGTSALIVLVENQQLFIANVGDCRAILGNADGTATALTRDHKPSDPDERRRMQDAVNGDKLNLRRVNGVLQIDGLSVSRSLGDLPVKGANRVIADPETFHYDLSQYKPKFLILASDGLWDYFQNQEAAEFLMNKQKETLFGARSITMEAEQKRLSEEEPKPSDNITVIIVKYK